MQTEHICCANDGSDKAAAAAFSSASLASAAPGAARLVQLGVQVDEQGPALAARKRKRILPAAGLEGGHAIAICRTQARREAARVAMLIAAAPDEAS